MEQEVSRSCSTDMSFRTPAITPTENWGFNKLLNIWFKNSHTHTHTCCVSMTCLWYAVHRKISLIVYKPPKRKWLISGRSQWPSASARSGEMFFFLRAAETRTLLAEVWRAAWPVTFSSTRSSSEETSLSSGNWWPCRTNTCSGVFAASLERPGVAGLVMHEAFHRLDCVICTPLLTHPDTLTFCLLTHRFGILPLLFLEATLF